MLVVAGSLATFVFGTGMRVLEMCHEAKQCEVQVARIAVRTQNVLGTLKNAGEHFSDEAQLETSLLELKGVFEILQSLVGRCGLPASYSKRASAAVLRRKNPNKQALADTEARLEQITKDLGLPMLTDIKQQLNRMQNESVASASRDTDALAEVIRSEIQRAMMVSVGSGVTIKDTIDAKVARIEDDTYDESKRAPPAEKAIAGGAEQEPGGVLSSKKVGSMVMMLGRVRYENLKEKEVLGQGTFGVVMAGTYDGREVAIKRARGCLGSTQIVEAFRQEVEIQYAMRHANIVEVIAFGLGDAERPPCLVMERMHESLYDLLGVQGIDLDPVSKVSIVQDVSEGLRFLHRRGIVHRDLKSLNILLDDAWTAKISDFGLAKVNSSIATVTGGGFYSKVGSDFWMAPEVHSNRKATLASDVFSLHVVMWEVLAQERAGHGKPIGERLQTNPTARLPPIDMDCSAAVESNLRNVVDKCGCSVPSERPKMDEVCSVVTAVLDHLEFPHENPLEEVAAVPAPRPQLQPHEEEGQQQDQQQQQQQREKRSPEERREQQGADASEQQDDEHLSTQDQQTHQRQTPQQHHHHQQQQQQPQEEEEEGGKQEGEKQEEQEVQEEEQKQASTEKQGEQQELQQAQQGQPGEQTKRQQEERQEDERRGEEEEEEEEENKQEQEQNEHEAEQDSQENEQEEQEKEQQETEQDAQEDDQERQKEKQQPQPKQARHQSKSASPSFIRRLRRTKKSRVPGDDRRGGATVEQPKREEPQDKQDSETQGKQHEDQGGQQEQEQPVEQTKRQQEKRREDERREQEEEENKQEQEENEQEAEQDSQENEQEKEQQETEEDAQEDDQEKQNTKQQAQPKQARHQPKNASPSFIGRLRRTKKSRVLRDDKRGGATVEQPKREEPQDEQDPETQGEQHEDQREQQEQGQPEQNKEEEKEAEPQETEPQGEAKQEQPEQQERERSKRNPSFMKRLGRRSKKDRPHGTTGTGKGETAVMSVGSNASSSSSSSTSKPKPGQRPHRSLDGTPRPHLVTPTARKVSSMGSPQPTQHDSGDELPPPDVSSESDASTPVTAKQDRRTDRAVLFKLLRQWSPSSATNSAARSGSEWTHSTGWGTRIAMGDWHGVRTRYEDDEEGRYERVTAIKLPMNGLSGASSTLITQKNSRKEEINQSSAVYQTLPSDAVLPGGPEGDLLEGVTTLDCLVDLDLKDNDLTGVLSASIGNLRFLETLDLSGTKLTGTIPRELGDLVALTVLDLHQTSLHGDIPETLGKLVCLETLDLSSCDLSGCIPTEFERLEALRVLRLGHNRLTGEIPAVLATLDRLEEINLGGNQLTGKILAVSGSWPGLRVLDMSDNRLEGCIPPELVEYEHLTTLILYRNFGITGSIPPWIGSMTSLEEMDLSAMQLGGEIPRELGQLTRLTKLSLGSCQLVGTIPPELGQLKSLQHLALYDNDMTGTFPREVLQIPTLRHVNFENNNFIVKKAVISGTKSAVKSMLPWGCSLRL